MTHANSNCPGFAAAINSPIGTRVTQLFMLLVLIPCFGLGAVMDANAQDEAFSTVTLGVNVAKDVNKADFQQTWSTRLAADVYAETPFYFGIVRLSARYFQASSPSLTDIRTLHMRASWGPDFRINSRIRGMAAVSMGSFYMSFEDEPVSYRKSESELVFGASTGMVVDLSSRISWEISAEWARAFTSTPLDFLFVSSGFRYTLASPKWLKSFLN
jgi:hypothetical protein